MGIKVGIKKLQRGVVPGFLLVFSATSAGAVQYQNLPEAFNHFKFSPYVGVDIGRSRVAMQKNFGEKIFRKNATTYNFFGGLDLNEYFGIEVGYEKDNARREHNAELVPGDFGGPGDVDPDAIIREIDGPNLFDTSFKLKQKYLGITAHYPILENISLSFLIGIARTTVKAEHTLIFAQGDQISAEDQRDFNLRRTYTQAKSMPMLRLGVDYKMNNKFSLKSNVTWVQTSRIKMNSEQNGQLNIDNFVAFNNSLKLKNSVRYSLGIVCHPFS